jgi:hypothetical protein
VLQDKNVLFLFDGLQTQLGTGWSAVWAAIWRASATAPRPQALWIGVQRVRDLAWKMELASDLHAQSTS